MTLTKTSLLNGLAVLARLGTQLFLTKVLAVYVGPAGFGIIGQFQNFVTMVTTFASGAVNQGVIKYTAEYAQDANRQRAVWATAGTLGLTGAVIVGLALAIFREPIASWALGSADNASVLAWLGASLAFLVLNGLMLAILNGRKAIGAVVMASIVGSVSSAAVATVLVVTMSLKGALLALCVSQTLASLFTAWIFRRECSGLWRNLAGRIDKQIARSLGGFALMALTTALLAPLTHLLIRNHVAATMGWSGAGIWQALWKVSEMHLLLITTTLSVYFLPRFSEISCPAELRREVLNGYRFVLPLVVASSTAIYLMRDALVRIALTTEFAEVADLLGLQLIGDVLKVGSWVMAFTMISHARTRVFIVTEVVFSAFLTLASILLVDRYGLLGATAAYALTYAIYWVTMYFLFNGLMRQLASSQASALRGMVDAASVARS